ncbi:hypothetical protein DSCO28_73060 (plasmid) [Desulfosarcina ovata subsp. sediminis]|uniref:Uncharacterized protein n=1 Tax=Desulfosarcina ovata subsp. sediminis TaxID=885957 RepID=A0A5K8A351_9BACT|nr:hypothetical protein DSCO28_73060 [Desulfosarcina ovata subsp. sediminis]
MDKEEFRRKYKGKMKERFNKAIRAEIDGGDALLELRRYVSYLRNVKPSFGLPEKRVEILRSIARQTPRTQNFAAFNRCLNECLEAPFTRDLDAERLMYGKMETLLGYIRDDMVMEIQVRYRMIED